MATCASRRSRTAFVSSVLVMQLSPDDLQRLTTSLPGDRFCCGIKKRLLCLLVDGVFGTHDHGRTCVTRQGRRGPNHSLHRMTFTVGVASAGKSIPRAVALLRDCIGAVQHKAGIDLAIPLNIGLCLAFN